MHRLIGWGIPLLLIAYLLTGVVQVRPGERAVVRRFGRVLPTKPEPGLWIGLPWGMDRVDRVVVDRVRSVVAGYQSDAEDGGLTMPPGQLLTGDHNLVNVQATVYYKVRPDDVADFVVQEDRVDALLARAAEAEMAEWVAGRVVDDVLLNGKRALRPDLVRGVQKRIGGYHLGVEILDARVGLVAPPAEVKDHFDAVAQAQTQIATKVNSAEQEAQRQRRLAESYRYKVTQDTAAHAYEQKLLARQDADAFTQRLRQYQEGRRRNPHYLRQIWEEERGRIFARLKENGQLDLLDHHLGGNGLDLTTAPPQPKP